MMGCSATLVSRSGNGGGGGGNGGNSGTGNRNRGPTAEDRLAMQDTADNVLKLHHFVNLSPMVAYVGVQFWSRESFWAAGAS